jgi:subtilase family serine protease
MQAAAENDRLARRRAKRGTEGNSLGGSLDKMELSAYLISTAITTNKIIAAVVVLVVIVAAVFFFMRRRTA